MQVCDKGNRKSREGSTYNVYGLHMRGSLTHYLLLKTAELELSLAFKAETDVLIGCVCAEYSYIRIIPD